MEEVNKNKVRPIRLDLYSRWLPLAGLLCLASHEREDLHPHKSCIWTARLQLHITIRLI
jgi:hypothetical protein